MAKNFKIFTVTSTVGDQYGATTSELYSNVYGETVWGNPWTRDELTQAGYSLGIIPSDFKKICLKINEYIQNEEVESFINLLKNDFIYPGKKIRSADHSNHSVGEWGPDCTYETHVVRPIVEELFFNSNPDQPFVALIDLLISKDNSKLYRAFINCLQGTDLDLTKCRLFSWDPAMKREMSQQVSDLYEYGHQLTQKKDDQKAYSKGTKIMEVANSLALAIKDKAPVNDIQRVDNKADFETLKFKFELMQALHSHDKDFEAHRGYKRGITNALTVLFTAGIANLIHRAATGNWLFFSNTTTKDKLFKIEATAGFTSPPSSKN